MNVSFDQGALQIYIAGVDEVGRGPLAGPVVTAAVILTEPIEGINDSKKLSVLKRKQLAKLPSFHTSSSYKLSNLLMTDIATLIY